MTAISNANRPYIMGYIDGDLRDIARKVACGVRTRQGHNCVVWVNERGAVIVVRAGSPHAPQFGDDVSQLVGIYKAKPDEIVWAKDFHEALVEQAASMKVAA